MSNIFCLANDGAHAVRVLNHLQRGGIPAGDISVLHSGARGQISTENSTKAPEGATAGAGTGAILGGAIGWLAGIGALAIPGLGPLVAAGPILAALTGTAIGGAVGGVAGGLIGMGIPEYEAQQYERNVREGKVLITIHAFDNNQAARIRTLLAEEKAEAVSTGADAVTTQH